MVDVPTTCAEVNVRVKVSCMGSGLSRETLLLYHLLYRKLKNAGLVRNLNENLKSKFTLILFVHNLMIGYSKKNREIVQENAFKEKKKDPG